MAVRSANGVGKTYLAADLALWFLYSFSPSVVLTTAPTKRQVENLLWEEIRKRKAGAKVKLAGHVQRVRITLDDAWFAIGQSASEADHFQGFHSGNILIIFDEASGIEDGIWEAAEGVAVGANNRILAIGNPLKASGRFYELFHRYGVWKKLSISALEHPNVTGLEPWIEGAVTPEAIADRVVEWCEEAVDAEEGVRGDAGIRGQLPAASDLFEWKGRLYSVNNLFRARVLGEFPDSDEEALIPLRWIEAAMERNLAAEGVKRAAVDVARFGGDSTVIGVRVGPVVTRIEVLRSHDTMVVSGRISALAYEEHPASIAVDEIGVGAGVVDRTLEMGVEGIVPVNVARSAFDKQRFSNRRAELYWGLRERFRSGDIQIPRDEALKAELAGLRYFYTSSGQVALEKKETMKRRGAGSPDRADMLAMLFDSSCDWVEGR